MIKQRRIAQLLIHSSFVFTTFSLAPVSVSLMAPVQAAENQLEYAAIVNDEVVSITEYLKIVERAKKQYADQMGMDFDSDQGRSMLEDLKKNIMDSLVDMTLMKQKAREINLSVSETEYAERYQAFLNDRYQGDEQAFAEDLQKNQISKAEFEQQFKDQIELQKLYQAIISTIQITDKEIADYYKSNIENFILPEQIEAQHILLKAEEYEPEQVKQAKAKAIKLIAELKKGANFETLAKKYSEDEGTRESGGDLGTFAKEQMVPEFEEAAWKLKPGQITQAPVQTKFGWHIIKRGKTHPAQQKKLAEVKDMIKSQLSQSKEKGVFENWLIQAKQTSTIVINQDILRIPPVVPKVLKNKLIPLINQRLTDAQELWEILKPKH